MTDQIFTKEELTTNPPVPDLPPAGYQREEVLAERTDTLAEKAETTAPDTVGLSPDNPAFDPEQNREIQADLTKGFLEVENKKPGYVYKWVYFGLNGQKVWESKSQGWEVVSSNDPESRHLIKEDGSRRVGDVLLMRMRMDFHILYEQREEKKRLTRELSVESELAEIVGKHPDAFTLHSEQTGGNPHMDAMRSRAARQTSFNALGNKLKSGTVPGLPKPGQKG